MALADLPFVTIYVGLTEIACASSKDKVVQKCLEAVGADVMTISEVQDCENPPKKIVALQIIDYHLPEHEARKPGDARGNAPVEGESVSITLQAVDQWGLPVLETDEQ
jgi:hypothetical protein